MSNVPTSDPKHVISTFKDRPVFSCARCSATLALQDELISKSFSGREGKAFLCEEDISLLHSVVNVRIGKKEDRPLLTGVHTVADIYCIGCGSTLGWTYLKAYEAAQKYKEGKYIVEVERVVKENNWKLED